MYGYDAEHLAFDYQTSNGATDVQVQHWDNTWHTDMTGLAPSASSSLVGIGSGDFGLLLLADTPATATGAYSWEPLLDFSWLADPAFVNPTGLPMERPQIAACSAFFSKYLAFQAGQDIYVEYSENDAPYSMEGLGKVTLPTGLTNVILRGLYCGTEDASVHFASPTLIVEGVPQETTQRAIVTFPYWGRSGTFFYPDHPITAPAGFDAVDPVMSSVWNSGYLAFRIPGSGIQVVTYDIYNALWNPVGGIVNAVPGQSPGAPKMAVGVAGAPIVAFPESDGSVEKLYFFTWDGTSWKPYDAPLGAAAGDTLAIDASGFAMTVDGAGQVEVAYPEDTPQGRRVVVQRHHP